jgi:hypothetical protein
MNNLKVLLVRHLMNERETLGKMHIINDQGKIQKSVCTLELPWRDNQRMISCVPEGEYPLILEWSPRFQTKLWTLTNVPNRSGIRIHVGNFTSQINGCILPGTHFIDLNRDGIMDVASSRLALNRFHNTLNFIDKTTIKIINYV